MISSHLPNIRKAKKVLGRTLVFRDANVNDAAFILELRTNSQKSRYLSATNADIEQQKAWLNHYAAQSDQAYFIIEGMEGQPLGTVRLYDERGHSFCWGSWILKQGALQSAAIESALMVYSYAIDCLGFKEAHFDVRKNNQSVWGFHERFGARRIQETVYDYLYAIDAQAIMASRIRYKKYLPEDVQVTKVD